MGRDYYSIETADTEPLNARLLSVSLSKDEHDWQSGFHTHPFIEIFYVVHGKGNFLFPEKSFSIKPGDLIIIPSYIEHTERSIPGHPLQYYVLGIDGITFPFSPSDGHPSIFCDFSTVPFITTLFEQILYEGRNREYGSDSVCQKLLDILILKIIRTQHLVPEPSNTSRMTKECAMIREYLNTNYGEHITLDSLTKLTHMNKYYMAHSFTKYTGLSPIQYLNERRLETACRLLKETDYSVSTISSVTGFSSQSYFTQSFRKKYGISPGKYRQDYVKKQSAPANEGERPDQTRHARKE